MAFSWGRRGRRRLRVRRGTRPTTSQVGVLGMGNLTRKGKRYYHRSSFLIYKGVKNFQKKFQKGFFYTSSTHLDSPCIFPCSRNHKECMVRSRILLPERVHRLFPCPLLYLCKRCGLEEVPTSTPPRFRTMTDGTQLTSLVAGLCLLFRAP